jgi:uncharacterized Fe-S cluster-containing radical SAM superfamily protein
MDKSVDNRFDRLEKALTSLIDSVNKYHPSTLHAQELEDADNELSRCLEEGSLRFTRRRSYGQDTDCLK